MNIIEIERLVRRIHSVLKGEGETATATTLAEQMKAVSASVALRLEQCRSMIEAGAAAQAVQLAETPPNLLDLVTLVEFREADDWRQYCQQKGLPAAEKLDTRAVTMLNDCYARGITPQHPVYNAYREAVLAKHDEAARMALLSIVRLNPGDTNAVSELARLDAKILAKQMASLEQHLGGDETAALRELERIEALGFKTKLTGEVWKRAQLLRCKKLMAEGEALMVAGNLSEVAALVDWLAQLKTEHGLDWPDDWLGRFTRLQDWCAAESMVRQANADYENQLDGLQGLIRANEGAPMRAPISELKTGLDALRKARQRLEKFSHGIPAVLQQRCQRCEARLEEQINQAAKKRFALAAMAVAAAVLILAAMALAALGLRNANNLAVELKSATDQHEVRSLALLVKRAQSPMVFGTAPLKADVEAARAEIAHQLSPLDQFETIFKKLPAKFDSINTLPEMDEVGTTLAGAEQAEALLVPELQREAGPEIQDFHGRWVNYCQQKSSAINQQVEAYIKNEDVLARADNLKDMGQFRENVTAAIPHLETLSRIITNLNNYVTMPAASAERCTTLLAQLRQAQDDVEKLETDVTALQQSRDLSEYAHLVAELAAIPIPQSDYHLAAVNAGVLNQLKDSPATISRRLLAEDNTALWNLLSQPAAPDLKPASLGTAERRQFMNVMQDYAVNGSHHRLDLYFDEQKSQSQSWITADALHTDEGWHAVPGWKLDRPGNCEFTPLDYGFFAGKCRLSDKQLVFEIKDTTLFELAAIWHGSGFDRLINTRAMTYNLPPLQVADALCADRGSSPLLRAYLLQELVSIMEQQPEASGLIFAPELRDLSTRLQAAGADQLHSGDWFIASRVTALQPGLDKLFDSLRSVAYEQEAAKFMNGINTAAKNGFSFSGYMGPDGVPHWASTPTEGYVWGFRPGTDAPGLLYLVHAGQARAINQALPLTPLMLFAGDLPAILAKTGVQIGGSSPKRWLPPLFAESLANP